MANADITTVKVEPIDESESQVEDFSSFQFVIVDESPSCAYEASTEPAYENPTAQYIRENRFPPLSETSLDMNNIQLQSLLDEDVSSLVKIKNNFNSVPTKKISIKSENFHRVHLPSASAISKTPDFKVKSEFNIVYVPSVHGNNEKTIEIKSENSNSDPFLNKNHEQQKVEAESEKLKFVYVSSAVQEINKGMVSESVSMLNNKQPLIQVESKNINSVLSKDDIPITKIQPENITTLHIPMSPVTPTIPTKIVRLAPSTVTKSTLKTSKIPNSVCIPSTSITRTMPVTLKTSKNLKRVHSTSTSNTRAVQLTQNASGSYNSVRIPSMFISKAVRLTQKTSKNDNSVANKQNTARKPKAVVPARPVAPFSCNLCSVKFNTYDAARNHRITVHLKNLTQCNLCNIYVKDLQAHNLKHHTKAAYRCEHCYWFKTIDKVKLKEHITKTCRYLNFKCKICDQMLSNKNLYVNHMLVKHSEKYEYFFSCDKCSYKCRYKREMKEHERLYCVKSYNRHRNQMKCKICAESFSTIKELREHSKVIHPSTNCLVDLNYEIVMLNGGTVHYKCEKCGQLFSNLKHFKAHDEAFHGPNFKPMSLLFS